MHSPLLLATLSLFLTFTGITLAAPAPAPAPVSVALDKRAYSVCCQDIVGGDLTLGTGTAFDCASGACTSGGTALTCIIKTGGEYNLCGIA